MSRKKSLTASQDILQQILSSLEDPRDRYASALYAVIHEKVYWTPYIRGSRLGLFTDDETSDPSIIYQNSKEDILAVGKMSDLLNEFINLTVDYVSSSRTETPAEFRALTQLLSAARKITTLYE